jgi:ligand-binding sensor domain-containing protein
MNSLQCIQLRHGASRFYVKTTVCATICPTVASSTYGRAYPSLFSAIRLSVLFWLCCVVYWSAHPTIATAQVRVSAWQTYSSLLNVRTTATDRTGTVWAATSGGVFAYNFANRTTREFRNINALYGLDITALAVNPADSSIYAGGFSGVLNIYDGKNWRAVTDIFTSSAARKQINSFLFRDSLVFIAGEFGLTVLNTKREIFTETVQRFSTLQPGLAVRQMLVAQGRLWVATEGGVASAVLGLRSYANPAVWTLHPIPTQTANTPVVAIAEADGRLYAALNNEVWRLTVNNRFDTLAASYGETVRSLGVQQNTLLVATRTQVRTLKNEVVFNAIASQTINRFSTIDSAGAQRLVLNTTQGFGLVSGRNTVFVQLNSPADNRFRSVSVDRNGSVWCLSGSGNSAAIPNDGVPTGISFLRDSVWRVFNVINTPQMVNNAYFQIDALPNGEVWAANYGRGMLRILPDSNFSMTIFNEKNSALKPASDTFVVGGQAQQDPRGTVWMTNVQTPTPIVARSTQGVFEAFGNTTDPSFAENRYPFLAIDRSGTKWLSTWRGTGMIAFNDGGTLDKTSDDTWYAINTSVIGEGQATVVADNDDRVWVGTPRNLYVIANPGVILNRTGTQSLLVDANRLLAGQSINDIAVDALNYKWIGTNNGVWVLDGDGGKVLAQFTTDNSPLVSNSVLSVAIDNNSGKIYFGTDNGLSVAQTLSVKPNTTFSTMRCYPQPFIPAQDTELVIDGLAEGSQVKIATIDGVLVRTFATTNSRTVVWDGMDNGGRKVQSGVYLISAYSDVAGTNAVIKAAVIQR